MAATSCTAGEPGGLIILMARYAALYFSARNIRPTSPTNLAEIGGPPALRCLRKAVGRDSIFRQ